MEENQILTAPKALEVERVKYCLYARKSTESDEKQALSIDSQVKEMLQIAERDELDIIDIRREAHSAKDSGQRPVFNEILRDIRSGRYTGLLTWAPDRLSRNAGDLGSLVDLIDQKLLIEIRTYGQRFSNSPNEKFLLMILCSQAKLENDNKSLNVKRGLKTRVEMGLWPSRPPIGYLSEKRIDRKCQVIIDEQRAPVIKQIFEKTAYEHWSERKIHSWLKFDLNFRSATSNKNLSISNIYTIVQNPFYYGYFEYPVKSGNWYKGKHEPIITKELFDEANQWLKRGNITNRESREFAFTKLMKCGLCGSGMTAEKKYKKLANGKITEYTYYVCSRSKDRDCKCQYIREESVIEQLMGMIDQLDFKESLIVKKFKEERERYRRFEKDVLKIERQEMRESLDVKEYVKYLFKKGSDLEKRDLLGSINGFISIRDKKITINIMTM